MAALRAHAKGLCHAEAAVELLVGHERWLCRDDFVGQVVWLGRAMVGERVLAVVDWPAAVSALAAGRLPCSDSEGQVLRIAASLAGGAAVDLRDVLSGLDAANIALVAAAVLRVGGHRGARVGVVGAAR